MLTPLWISFPWTENGLPIAPTSFSASLPACVGRPVDDGCQHREFVPTEACNQIRVADIQPKPLSDHTKKRVTHRMPQCVVDILEMVEIEKEHCKLLVASLGSPDGLLDLLQEYGSVEKPGKSVMTRAVKTFGFGVLAVGDVAEEPRAAQVLSRVSLQYRGVALDEAPVVGLQFLLSRLLRIRIEMANTRQKLVRIL